MILKLCKKCFRAVDPTKPCKWCIKKQSGAKEMKPKSPDWFRHYNT